LTSRRPRSPQSAGPSAPRHHCTRPAQKGSPPDGPRTRQVAPADARSKVTGSSSAPGSRPDRAPGCPTQAFAPQGNRPDRAATRTPGTPPPRGPRPPPFRCLSRDPKAAAHASLPLFTCPKTIPASGSRLPLKPGVRGASGHGSGTRQALPIAPDRVCRASCAPVQGPFGELAPLTVSPRRRWDASGG
jgi:hypothetical protein